MIKNIRTFWSNLNEFEGVHPDDARRGRILNVLLAGTSVLGIFAFIFIVIALSVLGTWDKPGNSLLVITVTVIGLGSVGLFYINQRSTKSAAFLFLSLLSIVFAFSDVPAELANGRSTFVFLITIAISNNNTVHDCYFQLTSDTC